MKFVSMKEFFKLIAGEEQPFFTQGVRCCIETGKVKKESPSQTSPRLQIVKLEKTELK